ncbi:MAG: hypothetical protein U0V70_05350 [Terriglobia bacterium]
MKTGISFLLGAILAVSIGMSVMAVDSKPNFSGTWVLNKEKSDLGNWGGSGRSHGSVGRMGGQGTGVPGSGYPGMGGPRMGGGMGGPRLGGGPSGPYPGDPGLNGSGSGQSSSSDTGEMERPRRPQIPATLMIEHEEPKLMIKQKLNEGGGDQYRELKYTTDGKINQNEGFRGYVVESQTTWKENQLVTKATIDTDNGTIKMSEVRSLSPDGKTMTVEIKSSGGSRDRQQKLVYEKE